MTNAQDNVTYLGDRVRPTSTGSHVVHLTHDQAGPLFAFTRMTGFLVSNHAAGTPSVRQRVEAGLVRLLPEPADRVIATVDLTEPAADLHTEAEETVRHLRLVG